MGTFARSLASSAAARSSGWVLAFLVIAIVAGVLGFGGIATASAGIAQTIFYIFLVLVLVSLVYRLLKGRGSI